MIDQNTENTERVLAEDFLVAALEDAAGRPLPAELLARVAWPLSEDVRIALRYWLIASPGFAGETGLRTLAEVEFLVMFGLERGIIEAPRGRRVAA